MSFDSVVKSGETAQRGSCFWMQIKTDMKNVDKVTN